MNLNRYHIKKYHNPIVYPTYILLQRNTTGQIQREFPLRAFPCVQMGSKEGGEIHQGNIWLVMVGLKNRREG